MYIKLFQWADTVKRQVSKYDMEIIREYKSWGGEKHSLKATQITISSQSRIDKIKETAQSPVCI